MNRRTFLKSVAASTVVAGYALTTITPWQALAAAFSLAPVQLTLPSRVLRGTRDGRVLQSLDSGKTWQQVANFGSHCSIQALVQRQGKLYARVGVQQYSFTLQSADDGQTWRTTGAIPA